MSILDNIAKMIIKEQELIIGPIAWYEARKVSGLNIDPSNNSVSSSGDAKEAINSLVAQYERLFGRASREVCRDAAAPFLASLSPSEIPSSLR